MNLRELRLMIEEFNIEYTDALDSKNLEQWTKFFTKDAMYKITSRDNVELGLNGGLVFDSGIGMIQDRAYILTNTQYFAPRHVRHVCGNVKILSHDELSVTAQSNFLYFETLVEEPAKLHLVGQYLDNFVITNNQLLLKERNVIYDNYMINNTLVYPI